MNPLHYPSLELCKKLTEAWFPETKYFWWWNHDTCKYDIMESYCEDYQWVCPSVMELLDEMPKEIFLNELKYSLTILSDNNWKYAGRDYVTQYWVRYETIHLKILKNIHWWNLPNALSEMWLWLKENNYLTK